jgi:plastocyanin
MRRAVLAATGVVALLLPAATADARRRTPVPARMLVEAREFSLTLSRSTLAAGPAVVQLVNQGEDGHDLRIERAGGRGGARAIRETRPGDTALWRGRLTPGRYKLYCSLPGHAAAGMRATVRVR